MWKKHFVASSDRTEPTNQMAEDASCHLHDSLSNLWQKRNIYIILHIIILYIQEKMVTTLGLVLIDR